MCAGAYDVFSKRAPTHPTVNYEVTGQSAGCHLAARGERGRCQAACAVGGFGPVVARSAAGHAPVRGTCRSPGAAFDLAPRPLEQVRVRHRLDEPAAVGLVRASASLSVSSTTRPNGSFCASSPARLSLRQNAVAAPRGHCRARRRFRIQIREYQRHRLSRSLSERTTSSAGGARDPLLLGSGGPQVGPTRTGQRPGPMPLRDAKQQWRPGPSRCLLRFLPMAVANAAGANPRPLMEATVQPRHHAG